MYRALSKKTSSAVRSLHSGINFPRMLSANAVRDSSNNTASTPPKNELPASADVVVIGGGSAGCHALYYLAKRGIRAVLLERAKLTSGTTWHTGGLIWRLRPNDVDIE